MLNENQTTTELDFGYRFKLSGTTIERLLEIRKTFGEMHRTPYRFLIVANKLIEGVTVQVCFPSLTDTSTEYASLDTLDGKAIAIAV